MSKLVTVLLGALSVASLIITSEVAYGAELDSAEGVYGLKINRRKVKVHSVRRKDIPAGISLRAGEQWIETENPRIFALLGYGPSGKCQLRLFDKKAQMLGVIECQSSWILIPRDRDIVWVLGKKDNEGLPDLGRPQPRMGLYQYDVNGRLLREIPKSVTGFIEYVRGLDSGEVFLLVQQDSKYSVIRIGVDGQIATFPIPAAKYEDMQVLRGGESIALRSFSWNDRKRKSVIVDAAGKELFVRVASREDDAVVAGMTPDGQHVALARTSSGRNLLEIYRIGDPDRPSKTIELPFPTQRAALSDGLNRIVASSSVGRSNTHYRYSYALLGDGETLATGECEHTDWRQEPRIDLGSASAGWLCGRNWINLEEMDRK